MRKQPLSPQQPHNRQVRRLLVILSFCGLAFLGPVLIAQSAADVATVITYHLDWQWGTAVPAADGQSWHMTNDLGYDITVKEGYLVSYSAELLACEPVGVFDWLLPETAHAGHGEDVSNSRTSHLERESLSQPVTAVWETRTGMDADYCQTHYLLGSDAGPADATLFISGQYADPTGDTASSFTFQTDLAWGATLPLTTTLRAQDTAVSLSIQRDISRLFQGIDFGQTDPVDIEKALLRNLIQATQIVIKS